MRCCTKAFLLLFIIDMLYLYCYNGVAWTNKKNSHLPKLIESRFFSFLFHLVRLCHNKVEMIMNVNKLFWRIHTVANFSLPTNLLFISLRAFIESISFANFVTKSWLIPFDLNYWSMLLSNLSNLNSLSSQ